MASKENTEPNQEGNTMSETKHDIGIVCMLGQNYGNQLTHFALYKYVTSLGYSAVLIDFPDDCNMAKNMPIEHQYKFKNWIKTPYPEKDVLVHLPQNCIFCIIRYGCL